MNNPVLTKVGIKEYAETRAGDPKRGEQAPHFGRWKLEDPWQMEDNPTTVENVAVYKERRPKCQSCESPVRALPHQH